MPAVSNRLLSASRAFSRAALRRPLLEAAQSLLGATLARRSEAGEISAGRIVEVEAYGREDEASHTFRGLTRRNQSMFAGAGIAYVYRSYGIHWCVNIVLGPTARGEAILVRALAPTSGILAMQARRGETARSEAALCRGPGNLCRALSITGSDDGLDLLDAASPLQLWKAAAGWKAAVVASPRIGIRLATDRPWRFYLRDEHSVSRRARPI